MHGPSLVLLVALTVASITQVSGEYIWTGTEWKWQDPDSSDSVGLNGIQAPEDSETEILDTGSEGSGDGDTWDDEEEYDDDYDYDQDYRITKQNNKKEKKKKDKKDRKKNRDSQFYPSNSNSAILPATDDEDLFEGSGDIDGFDSPSNHNDFNFNNNNNNNFQYNTESPINNNNNNNNNNNQNEYFEKDDEYDYEENYDYEDYKDYDPIGNNINIIEPTDAIHNNFNPPPTPSTTVRSFTTKRTTTTTSRPDVGSEHDENTRIRVNRPASFFAQPGILAAVIGGAVVGLLCAILLVMFIVYRMRKKDEGSYALDEPKRSHNVNSYSKPPNREFYA